MMHYSKGENIEREITKDELPFDDCWPNGQKDFLWMHVKGGTKVNNVIAFAKNALEKGEHRTIVWTGVGGGLVKTVSCAEIIKRTHPLYQVTRMSYTNIEEHWLPQMEGLDEIVVNRKIPCLHILMSLDEIDESVNGLQKPNTKTNFFGDPKVFNSSNRHGQRQHGGRTSGGATNQNNQNRNQYAGRNEQRSTKYQKTQRDRTDNTGDPNRQQKTSSQSHNNAQKNRPFKKYKTQHGAAADKSLETQSSAENSTAAPSKSKGSNDKGPE